MQTQLFETHGNELTPPASNPTTSRAAAEAIEPTAATLRRQVLDFIESCGDRGATDCEIQAALGMSGDTQRPRRWELSDCESPLIVDSGLRRRTERGREAIVWRVKK